MTTRENIAIKALGIVLTEQKLSTAEKLRGQLYQYGCKSGHHFEILEIVPPGDHHQSFAAGIVGDKITFIANIRTMLGCVNNMEGVITHETVHLHYANRAIRLNLELAESAVNSLLHLKNALRKHPVEVLDRIIKFGSFQNPRETLPLSVSEVTQIIEPVFAKLKKMELYAASPERLATAMENADSAYQQLRQTLKGIWFPFRNASMYMASIGFTKKSYLFPKTLPKSRPLLKAPQIQNFFPS